MRRILHIVSAMNRGGAETFIMNVYRTIDKEKIQFDFITQTNKKSDYDDEIHSLGGKIYNLPKRNMDIIGYFNGLIKILRENPQYKVVHIHTDGATSIIDTICCIICGIKVRIVHSHNTKTKRNKLNKVLSPFLNLTTTNKLACSKDAGEWLFGKSNIYSRKIEVIANGIEVDKFLYNENTRLKKRNELNISKKFVVGHIGRFNIQKNHEFLIEVFYEIQKEKPDSVLLLIGKGELESKIKSKVEEKGITNKVKFLGMREDVSELLQAMDVFVFPSIYEGLPLTLIEAQASGIPIFKADSITDEVNITNLVSNLSLNIGAKKWAKNILNIENFSHKEMNEEFKKSEFNIENSAQKLINIYIKM